MDEKSTERVLPLMEEGKNHPSKFRMTRRNRWVLLAAMCTILAMTAIVLTVKAPVSTSQTLQAQPPIVAPGFTLRDQQNRPTSLAQYRDKVVALTFIDPECHQLCPLTTRSMTEALKILGPAAASHVQLLGIDANPQKTQVSDVADYTRVHDLEGRWRFLTGSHAQLAQIWRQYHIYVAVVNNDIEHTAIVMLIDQNGRERNIYSTPMSYSAEGDQAHILAAGIASLLTDHPAGPQADPASQKPQGPPQAISTMSLTALGPEGSQHPPVMLGSAHAHLTVFFAGWLGHDSNLPRDLAALDSYAILARQRGWPSPVAVDELTTEPSSAEARQVLTPLAATLHTPIVEDASGRLADNYHVDDLPWFVLSSASGKILWHHDGWLTAPALKQQVSTALAGS